MSELAGRAEEIAAHLAEHALGAKASKFDAEGRQSVVLAMAGAVWVGVPPCWA